MTLLAEGFTQVISGIGISKIARRCNSNSLRFWLINVTSPVSCGLGDSSEKITSSPLIKNSTPNNPTPPRLSVIDKARRCAFSKTLCLSSAGCQLH